MSRVFAAAYVLAVAPEPPVGAVASHRSMGGGEAEGRQVFDDERAQCGEVRAENGAVELDDGPAARADVVPGGVGGVDGVGEGEDAKNRDDAGARGSFSVSNFLFCYSFLTIPDMK